MKFTLNPFHAASSRSFPVDSLRLMARLGVPAVFSLAMAAHGATIYWDGSGGASWATVASWSTVVGGGTNPSAVPGSADVANFSSSNISTAQTVNLDADRSVQGLVFLGTNTATTTLLGGGTNRTLTLGTLSGITVNSGAGAVTIGSATDGQQVAVTLGIAQSWTNNSTNPLTVANGVTNGGLLLTLAGTGNTNLNGIVSGTGGLTQSGAGTTTLSGANTYSGVTSISAGTLKLGSATALGATTSGTTIGTVGTLDLNGQTVGAEPITLGAAATSRLVNENTGAAASISGGITTGNLCQIGGAGNLTLSGVIATGGNQAMSKIGSGTLTLTGTNLFTRALTISAGAVNVQNSSGLGSTSTNIVTVATGAALELQGGITLGAKPLTLNGTGIGSAGALRNISGANSYTPAITLASASRINSDAGTLTLASITGTFGLTVGGAENTTISGVIGTGAGTLTKDGLGILTLSGTNTFTGVTTVSSGILSVATIANGGTASNLGAASDLAANLVLAGGTLRYTGASFDTNRAFTLAAGTTSNIDVSTLATTLTIGGASANTTGALTKTGAGILLLRGQNLYTGLTTVSAGTLTFGNTDTLSNGAVTVDGGTLNVATFNDTVGAVTLTSGSITGSTGVLTGTSYALNGTVDTSVGAILGGAGALTKSGAGIATLSRTNTFTGLTTVSGGTLRYGITNALSSGAVTVNGGVLDVVTFNDTVGAVTLTSGSITGTTGILTGTSYALNGAVDTSVSAILAGAGALTQSGAGTATLSGVNTRTGITSINAGTLSVATIGNGGVAGNLGAAPIAATNLVLGGGTLQYTGATASTNRAFTLTAATTSSIDVSNAANTLTMSGASTATTGALAKTGAGTLVLSGANLHTGLTTVSNGTLRYGTTNALSSGAVTVNGGILDMVTFNDTVGAVTLTSGSIVGTTGVLTGTSYTLNGAGSTSVSAILGGAVTLAKSAAGTATLSGANTYTGATTITAGALNVQNATGLGTAAAGTSVTAGAALQLQGGILVGAEALTLNGTGVATDGALRNISGVNTYGGLLTLGSASRINSDAGTLTLSNVGTITGAGLGLTVGGAGNTSITSIIGTTSGTLTKDGAGTLSLSGANSYTGATTVSAGVLRVTNANGLGTAAGNTTVVSGAALELSGGITIGAEALSLSGSGIASGGALRSLSGNTIYGGAITGAANSLIMVDNDTLTLNGVVTSASDTTFGGAGNVIAAGGVTGAGNVIKAGSGTLTLAVGNGQANTTVNEGQLNVNHLAALGTPAGTLTLAAGILLDNTSGAAVTVTNPKAIALGSDFTFVGSNNLDLGTGTVTLAGNTAINVAANQLTFSGNVAGSGFGLTKTGAGTLRLDGLTGAGSFTGNSSVNAGRLVIGGTSTLGGGASTVVTVATGAFLEIEANASAGSVTLVSRPDGLITSNLVSANQTFTSSGALSSSNANFDGVVTVGSGVTVTAAANYLGSAPATATSGRIVFESNSKLQATAGFTIGANQGISLAGGTANFEVNPNQALIVESIVAGSGGVAKVGSGNMRLTGVNTYTGGTVVSAGILGITSGESLGGVGGALKLDGGTLVGAQVVSGTPISAVSIAAQRSLVLTNGKTSGIDAQSGLSLRYDGVIGEENGAGAAAGLRIGSSAARTGTVILGGNNTYQGATTVDFGTLSVSSIGNGGVAGNLGAASNAATNLVLGGGTLRYTGVTDSTNRAFTLTNATTSSIEVTNAANTLTMSGASAATTGGLTKTGTGTLALTGANAFAGDVRVANGTLSINTLAGLGSAQSLGTGAQGQVYLGLDGGTGGTLLYTGAAGTLNHPINVLGVGSAVRNGGTGLLSIQGTITKSSGTLLLDGATAGITVASEILGTAGGITTAGLVSMSGAFLSPEETLDVEGTLSLGSTNGGVDQTVAGLTGTGTVTGAGATVSTLTVAVTTGTDTFEGNLGGSTAAEKNLGLSKSGNGTLVLSGNSANTFTGLTTVGGGTLRLAKASAQALGGDVRIDSGTMEIAASEQISNSSNVTIAGGTITFAGSGRTETVGTFTNSGGTFTTGANTLIGSGNSIYFSGGTNTINSGGLTQDAHYEISGGTNTVEAGGILEVTSGGIGLDFTGSASPSLVLQSSNSTAGKLLLSGNLTSSVTAGTALVSSSGSGSNAGIVDLNAGNRTFTVGNGSASTDLQISAVITNGSLTKAGAGNLALTGANTYSGGTALTAGSVSISAANNLGTGTITFSNGARIIAAADGINLTQSIANSSASQYQVDTGNTATLSGVITGFGQLQKFGAGTLVLDNANTYSGKTVVNEGTLKLGTSGSITATNFDVLGGTLDLNGKTQSVSTTLTLGSGSSSGTISGGGTIDVSTTFSLIQGSISSTMAGSGAVSKTGSTTVTLAGANTYSGATTVAAGKLVVNGSTSTNSAVGVSSGATLAGSGTVGGNTTVASGGALAPGNSPGVLTVSGTTTLNSGSMFEWEIDTAQGNPETNRGVAYDGLNTTALAGSGAFFKVMLTGTQDFTDDFWNQNRTWTDIFKSSDGSSILSNWASVFSGGFQYAYNGQTVEPTSQGFFTTTGSSLTWSAVPEPSNLLAGMLAASALLRRRRAV